jgi:zinc transporter ZupT
MFGLALALSVAGLMIGPLVTTWAHRRTGWLDVLDAALLGGVLPLVLFRLVPHLVDEIGGVAVLGVAGGYVAFAAIEGRSHRGAARLGTAILLPTLAIHSLLDGTALAVAFQQGGAGAAGAALGLALVIHRVPEGMVIAVALVPTLGVRATMLRIGALAAATVVGALGGRELLAHAPDRALHVVVAVGLGVMLRMVVHNHRADDRGHDAARAWPAGLAFLAAAAVALCVPEPWQLLSSSQPDELPVALAIVPLFLETAPRSCSASCSVIRGSPRGRATPRGRGRRGGGAPRSSRRSGSARGSPPSRSCSVRRPRGG